MQSEVVVDTVRLWLDGLEKEKTRETYDRALRRLGEATGLTPSEMLNEARRDMKHFWISMKADASKLKPHVRASALSALRSYLRAHGEFPPYDRLRRPRKTRRSARITWEQALKILDAAAPPYRWVFRMMLHCGWGIGEFFEWNRAENWESAKLAIHAYPPPEYHLFQFEGRKSNDQPFHSLIPTFALNEIFEAKPSFPLRTAGGQELDLAHYHNSKVSVDSAFRTALKRARINLTGHLSPHDLRDVFRTQATIQGVDYDAREFSLGHTIDPRGYDKCYANLPWLWGELSKIYKQPSPERIRNMAKENEELRIEVTRQGVEIKQIRGMFETALKTKITG